MSWQCSGGGPDGGAGVAGGRARPGNRQSSTHRQFDRRLVRLALPWPASGPHLGAAADELPRRSKKCAGTLYFGIENETNQATMFGLTGSPALGLSFLDSYFISGSFSRTFAEIGPYISYEIEDRRRAAAWVAPRGGSLARALRTMEIFSLERLRANHRGVSTGLDYASAVPQYEDFLQRQAIRVIDCFITFTGADVRAAVDAGH